MENFFKFLSFVDNQRFFEILGSFGINQSNGESERNCFPKKSPP